MVSLAVARVVGMISGVGGRVTYAVELASGKSCSMHLMRRYA